MTYGGITWEPCGTISWRAIVGRAMLVMTIAGNQRLVSVWHDWEQVGWVQVEK